MSGKELSENDQNFIMKLQVEGTGYGLCHYFGMKRLKEVEDPELKKKAIAAKKSLSELEKYMAPFIEKYNLEY